MISLKTFQYIESQIFKLILYLDRAYINITSLKTRKKNLKNNFKNFSPSIIISDLQINPLNYHGKKIGHLNQAELLSSEGAPAL